MDPAALEDALKHLGQRIYAGWIVEDMPVIQRMHPDALLIVPLYRSAIVILPPTDTERERGAIRMIVYHDPGWMGRETTPETLTYHSATLTFWGQRNGPDVTYKAQCSCWSPTFENRSDGSD